VQQNWLQTGAVYYVVAAIWAFAVLFFGVFGFWLGNSQAGKGDGCLLSICNMLLATTGAAIGFLLLREFYPGYIVGVASGAFLTPFIGTVVFLRKSRRRRR
jgi:hypothetical protein